jgi:N utilization substance protein B
MMAATARPNSTSKGASPKPANARGVARLIAVQALYQMDVGGTTLPQALAEFEMFRLADEVDGWAYRPADKGYFRHLVQGVVDSQKTLDPAIHSALPDGWPLTRLDTLLRAILRTAAFEIMKRQDIPAPVILNEYVDVAKAFYEDQEVRLTNGVLNALVKRFRA